MKLKKNQNHKSTESEKEEEEEETPTGFAFTVTKVAVSQICSSSRYVGFKAAESSALETLTLVATKYLQELATTAASYSHAANRTESNLFDLTNALNDMSFGVGFPGASTLSSSNCWLSSGALKEIASFVKHSSEIPFAKPIRRNRRNVKSNSVCCKKEIDWASRSLHIPKWLPAFPDDDDEETCKERQGPVRNISERLWENSEIIIVKAAESCNFGGDDEGDDVLRGGNLAKERDRVRFKIGVKGNNGFGLGVDLRNGVCRGGKRVSWNVGDIVEDDQNRGFKYKRSF